MSSQIFKTAFPMECFSKLLKDIAMKTEQYYVINKNTFKKGMFYNTIPQFIEECKPFYHLSKQKYLNRELTYNSFITVIRQICKSYQIHYTYLIKYDKSYYDIIYNIYWCDQI